MIFRSMKVNWFSTTNFSQAGKSQGQSSDVKDCSASPPKKKKTNYTNHYLFNQQVKIVKTEEKQKPQIKGPWNRKNQAGTMVSEAFLLSLIHLTSSMSSIHINVNCQCFYYSIYLHTSPI